MPRNFILMTGTYASATADSSSTSGRTCTAQGFGSSSGDRQCGCVAVMHAETGACRAWEMQHSMLPVVSAAQLRCCHACGDGCMQGQMHMRGSWTCADACSRVPSALASDC